MNILSLFDGISCGRLALGRAGISVTNYYSSEIDPYAIQVSNNNYPDLIRLGDIRNVSSKNLPKIDIALAGSPCQGFSSSGYKLGLNDPRSSLFFEFVRLLNECKPRYFLLENVCMKKEWSDIITSHVGVEPVTINSSLVSAQLRKRMYWTNIPFQGQPEAEDIILQDIIEDGVVDRDKSYCLTVSYSKGSSLQYDYIKRKARQVVFDGSVDGYRRLTPLECERLQTLPDGYTAGVSDYQRYKMLGNAWTVDVISHLLSGIDKGGGDKL